MLAFRVGDFQESFGLVQKALAVYPDHADSVELMRQVRSFVGRCFCEWRGCCADSLSVQLKQMLVSV